MFQQLKNIDSAFKHVRVFSIVYLVLITLLSGLIILKSFGYASKAQQVVYIMSEGKILQAFKSSRKENIAVEGKRHVLDFHSDFFNLIPDEKAIASNMKRAMYLGDNSIKQVYDDLQENGWFQQLVSSNTSQELLVDSITVETETQPYYFRLYGKLKIMRPLSVTTRSLVTEGYLRDLQERTDNDPNGFLIEHWKILNNQDLETHKR